MQCEKYEAPLRLEPDLRLHFKSIEGRESQVDLEMIKTPKMNKQNRNLVSNAPRSNIG